VPAETPSEQPAEAPQKVPAEAPSEAPAEAPVEAPVPSDDSESVEAEAPEMEVFYTFAWGVRQQQQRGGKPARPAGDKPRGKGKPKGKGGKPQQGGKGGQRFEARPPKEKKIDPDNPFAAALSGFKTK